MISEKIEALEQELREVIGGIDDGGAPATTPTISPVKRGRKPKAQQGQESVTADAPVKRGRKPGRKKRIVSPEARAKMAEAQRRRWAKARK